jgi:glycosyltransferase involved in cell wall biosynthesis
MRVVMLTGHAPGWRHPWERAGRLVADVVTLRTPTGVEGGVRRVGLDEYELGVVKVQPERVTAAATALVMRRRIGDALAQIERDHGAIDLLHAHFYSAAMHVGGLGIPYVVSEHTTVFTRAERDVVVRRSARVAQRVYDRAAMVMPVSNTLEHDMRRSGIRGTLRVVPNPIDVEAFVPVDRPPRDGEIRVLFAQRLAGTKGLDTLLRAVSVARRREPRLVLRIAGEGGQRAPLELLVRALDLDGAVRFLGQLDRPELVREMHAANLFAFPSRGDSFGLPVVEALCTGLPVVATAQGVVPDVVTSERGRLVPVDDVRALADALVDVSTWAPSASAAAIASGVAARFSPEAVAERLGVVYRLAVD